MNMKCLHCGRVLQAKGFPMHMKTHEGEPQLPGGDWKKTVQNPTPGKRKRNKKGTKRNKQPLLNECVCLTCGKHKNNYHSMQYHLKTKHKNKKIQQGTDWMYWKDAGKQPYPNIELARSELADTKTKTKTKPQVITPDMQYIDIPIILRVPISLGQVQIKQTEE